MLGADNCLTERHLLFWRLKISIRRPPRWLHAGRLHRRYDYAMLHGAQISEHLELSVEKYINDSSNTEIITEKWTTLRDTISAAEQDVGIRRRKGLVQRASGRN